MTNNYVATPMAHRAQNICKLGPFCQYMLRQSTVQSSVHVTLVLYSQNWATTMAKIKFPHLIKLECNSYMLQKFKLHREGHYSFLISTSE